MLHLICIQEFSSVVIGMPGYFSSFAASLFFSRAPKRAENHGESIAMRDVRAGIFGRGGSAKYGPIPLLQFIEDFENHCIYSKLKAGHEAGRPYSMHLLTIASRDYSERLTEVAGL